jgi:hypothetical protein
VAYLVAEKSNNPRWALPPGFNLNMDPRSRYYDPTNPDHPPIPPDDPYAHVYMHRVDGKRASPFWHINGELPQLPNPGWRQRMSEYCQMTPEGAVKLDLAGAIALSYIHNPTHRTQIETIYLSALDVSAERFRFNLQFYPGSSLSFLRAGTAADGVAVPGTPGHPAVVVPRSQLTESNGTAAGSPGTISKEFATGGTLLVNFANSFVWQLAGPHTNTTNSLINMNLVQPLLQNGGRIITLETLTRAERQLLYNLRLYERWRQGWFLSVAVGAGGTTALAGPGRSGGAFGGTGITGFTGTGVGGIGGVAANAGFGGGLGAGGGGIGGIGGISAGAVAGAAGGGQGTVAGFYGLLQQQVQIDNAQNALNLQIRTLKLLEANLDAGMISLTQVDLFRQSIETNKANLILARLNLENTKDTYKSGTLGLPPDLPMVFDDPLIKQFQLIDPRLNDLQSALIDLTQRSGTLPENATPDDLLPLIDALDELRGSVQRALLTMREDLRTLDARTDERTRTMTPAAKQQLANDKQRLNDRSIEIETRFDQTEPVVQNLRQQVGSRPAEEIINGISSLTNILSGLAQEASLVKATARVESLVIKPVELSTVDALQIARAHRLDLMNVRAQVVDQWRLICYNANALRSVLNLTANGSLGTVGNNPAKFEANNGELTLGVQFAPPFTRLLQRNNYRQALVQYQQVRRAAIGTEDSINFALRGDMRSLKNFEINFEIQREASKIAIRRVDTTRLELSQPPPPVVLGQPPQALGETAATNLLTALQALSDSQNNLMSAWLQHYDERIQLAIDLGVMRLDERGIWIDESIDQSLAQLEQMYPLPPELPVDWLKDAGLAPPALYPNQGVPPLGGTTYQIQAEAATPESVEPRMDVPRPEERQPGRDIESLPAPEREPAPGPDEARNDSASDKMAAAKKKGWLWSFKKPAIVDNPKKAAQHAGVVAFRDAD